MVTPLSDVTDLMTLAGVGLWYITVTPLLSQQCLNMKACNMKLFA